MGEMKLAVLFPGIGYHCDKPLLYYAAKLAKTEKYEVLPVPYTGFPEKVRGNMDKMRVCLEIAWSQANELLMSSGKALERLWVQRMRRRMASMFTVSSSLRLQIPSDMFAAMPSLFTEPLIRGRRRTRLWKRAGREAFRFT